MKTDPTILILLSKDDASLSKIQKRFPKAEVRVGPWVCEAGVTLPREMLRGIDVLFCELPPANFADFDRLKWIQLTSAGYTQVLNLPILEKKIRVTNGLGTFDIPIAEWNIMMMLWWHRNMLDAQASQRAAKWDRAAKYQRELRGSTVGFYGYGGIARETTRIAKAMGLTVWALTRGPVANRSRTFCVEGTGDPEGVLPDRVFSPDQIKEFMGGLDYLIVTVPLTPVTKGIVGEKELRMLQPHAVLINCARAPIIEEQAYIRCLREGWIRGSSLDVHYAYPLPTEHPLWRIPNLIMTSHISGAAESPKFLPRAYSIFVQNMERYCAGKPLLNELTTAQLQGK
jgi:phosphoglycerate dehydrogenase-like enzyme